MIVTVPEEPVTVMADSRHMWRVLDNLMNNVCKYAMPGTRVYVNLEKKDGQAVMIFRNISRCKLSMSSDMLLIGLQEEIPHVIRRAAGSALLLPTA